MKLTTRGENTKPGLLCAPSVIKTPSVSLRLNYEYNNIRLLHRNTGLAAAVRVCVCMKFLLRSKIAKRLITTVAAVLLRQKLI